MTKSTIDPECTGQFTPLFLDYIQQKKSLQPFYSLFPNVQNFQKIVEERNFDKQRRDLLVETLQNQYSSLEIRENTKSNLRSLRLSNTFTVTTGHQLNLFTGPLYFIYKIVSTINLAQKLNEAYPSFHFVPVYWMASEDHDFMEINHFYFDGKKFSWDTDQEGAVGEFELDQGLRDLLQKTYFAPEFLKKAYLEQKNLADAVRYYVHHLFGDKGLLIVDANAKALKDVFKPVIKDDVFNQKAWELVSKTTEILNKMGYKEQIFPRPINFFYMDKGIREGIPRVENEFRIVGTEKSFSEKEMLDLIEKSPETLSPNVVMRPLYQEHILPNVAYLGGPAEVAYWLQLRGVFQHYQTQFPIILPRNFVMVLNRNAQRKIKALQLEDREIFTDFDQWKKEYVINEAGEEIILSQEKGKLAELFEIIREKARKTDPTLIYSAEAAKSRAVKILDHFEEKLRKAAERKSSTNIKKMLDLKEMLFPGGSPQERKENFLQFFLEDPDFIENLYEHLDPLDFDFIVLRS